MSSNEFHIGGVRENKRRKGREERKKERKGEDTSEEAVVASI